MTSSDPTGGESAWTISHPDALSDTLTGVSCVAENLCIAVDNVGNVIPGIPGEEGKLKEEPKEETGGGTTGGGTTGGGTTGGGTTGGGTTGGGTTGTAIISSAQITTLLLAQLAPGGKSASISSLLKHGGLPMSFKALEAGSLVIGWYEVPAGAKLAKAKPKPVLVAKGQAVFSAAGMETVKVKLTAAGRSLLKRSSHLKLVGKATFTPTGKAPISTTRSFSVAGKH
jgi:hypothetical protein